MSDARVETERGPAVLIIGGLLTSWVWYWPVRGHLMSLGASQVAVAPLWLLDWLVAGFLGPGRATSVVAAAINRLASEDGRPIMVVGHSGGGILARLALAREPFDGACMARPTAVGAVVTLGTPHRATRFGGTIGRQGLRALRFLRRLDRRPRPDDPFAMMTVGGRLPPFGSSLVGRLRRGFSMMCYAALLGSRGRRLHGDGLVPQSCALLPHGTRCRLDGVAHAPLLGSPWYFSEEGIRRWWGPALEAWHAAVISSGQLGRPGKP